MGQFGVDFLIGSGFAYLMFAALFALPIAIIVTLLLIRRFRARVERSMRQAALPAASDLNRAPPSGSAGELTLEWIAATPTRAAAPSGATPKGAMALQLIAMRAPPHSSGRSGGPACSCGQRATTPRFDDERQHGTMARRAGRR